MSGYEEEKKPRRKSHFSFLFIMLSSTYQISLTLCQTQTKSGTCGTLALLVISRPLYKDVDWVIGKGSKGVLNYESGKGMILMSGRWYRKTRMDLYVESSSLSSMHCLTYRVHFCILLHSSFFHYLVCILNFLPWTQSSWSTWHVVFRVQWAAYCLLLLSAIKEPVYGSDAQSISNAHKGKQIWDGR